MPYGAFYTIRIAFRESDVYEQYATKHNKRQKSLLGMVGATVWSMSFLIYVMPVVWFSDWVSHIRISFVTVHSYAPVVVAM